MRSIRTSGCPSGRRKASGTSLDASVRSPGSRPAEYSVNGIALPLIDIADAILDLLSMKTQFDILKVD